MYVRDWMTSPVLAAGPEMTVHRALDFMRERKVRRLPVVDGERLVGIVTEHDLLPIVGRYFESRRGEGLRVGQVMTREPVTIAPDEPLENAAQIMLRRKVSGLPVVEGGRLVGMLTESDVFRAVCELMGIGEGGPRVYLTLGVGEDLLQALASRVNGGPLRSVVARRNAGTGRWEAVLRLGSPGEAPEGGRTQRNESKVKP